jgi:hypothetical protein
MNDTVELKAQMSTGEWRTMKIVEYINDQYVIQQMKMMKASMPNMRWKAVSKREGLIDILD